MYAGILRQTNGSKLDDILSLFIYPSNCLKMANILQVHVFINSLNLRADINTCSTLRACLTYVWYFVKIFIIMMISKKKKQLVKVPLHCKNVNNAGNLIVKVSSCRYKCHCIVEILISKWNASLMCISRCPNNVFVDIPMERRFNIYSIIWRYLQIFEDIFKWIKDIFKSFEDIFNSFEDIFKWFEDIFKSFKDIFNSFEDISKWYYL